MIIVMTMTMKVFHKIVWSHWTFLNRNLWCPALGKIESSGNQKVTKRPIKFPVDPKRLFTG